MHSLLFSWHGGTLFLDDTFFEAFKERSYIGRIPGNSQGHRDIICCHPNPRVRQGLCDRTVWVPVWLENRLEFYKTCYLNYWIVWRSLSAALSKTVFFGDWCFSGFEPCENVQSCNPSQLSLRVDLVIWSQLGSREDSPRLNVLKRWAHFMRRLRLVQLDSIRVNLGIDTDCGFK